METPAPPGVNPMFWDELVEEAWGVARNWADAAIDAGWRPIDLFGCNPDPFARRVDRSGLVFLSVTLRSPVRIVGIDATCARLLDPNDHPMSFRPPVAPGAVFIWEAYAMTTGP